MPKCVRSMCLRIPCMDVKLQSLCGQAFVVYFRILFLPAGCGDFGGSFEEAVGFCFPERKKTFAGFHSLYNNFRGLDYSRATKTQAYHACLTNIKSTRIRIYLPVVVAVIDSSESLLLLLVAIGTA